MDDIDFLIFYLEMIEDITRQKKEIEDLKMADMLESDIKMEEEKAMRKYRDLRKKNKGWGY